MTPPTETPEFDAYAENYDEALNQGLKLSGEGKEYFAEGRVQWLRGLFAKLGVSPQSCLDFGCGTGTSAPYLTEGLGVKRYVGYDPSSDSIRQAKEAFGDLGSFVFESGEVEPESLDMAFTNGVFHHILPSDRPECVRLVFEALRPGGVFAFWENNRWNPMVHLIMSRVPFDRDAQMLFPHQARKLLRAAGFEIDGTDYLFVFPSVLSALRGIEPAMCKLPLGGQYLVLARKPGASGSSTLDNPTEAA